MTLIKVSINCQNPSVLFWQLIESSNNGILGFLKFRSSAKKEPTDFGSWSNYSINWSIFRRLIEKFRSSDSIKWNSIKWPPVICISTFQRALVHMFSMKLSSVKVWWPDKKNYEDLLFFSNFLMCSGFEERGKNTEIMN